MQKNVHLLISELFEWIFYTTVTCKAGCYKLSFRGRNKHGITYAAFLDKWLELLAKPNNRIGTVKKYESHIKIIKEDIGHICLDKLTGMNIQQFIVNRKNAGATGSYMYDQFATIRRSLDCAVKWGLIPKNPAAGIDNPPKNKSCAAVLSPQQVEMLLDILTDTDIYLPILLGVLCGLRRGEICGLRWSDINFKQKTAMISRSLDMHDSPTSRPCRY
jgi:integrase